MRPDMLIGDPIDPPSMWVGHWHVEWGSYIGPPNMFEL